MININNFFLNTYANYKFIGEIKNIENISENKQLIANILNIDINDIELNYKSIYNISAGNWKIKKAGSVYYYIRKWNAIVRVSDHWSFSNIKKVNQCSYIRSCYWNLIDSKYNVQEVVKQFQIGIINFNKMSILK